MLEEEKIVIEEVTALDMPATVTTTIKPHAPSTSAVVSVPADVYRQYGQRKFRLLREAKDRVKSTLLDMDTWNVLWQIDGRRTINEVAENLMMPLEVVVYHVECLKYMGIICPQGAVYLPEFIVEKTEKRMANRMRRKEDDSPARDTEN